MSALLERMARANAWANHRLHAAIAELSDSDYRATRTSFFPSIHATLAHILYVDEFYVASLEGYPLVDRDAHWRALDQFSAAGSFAELRERQRAVDQRLIATVASDGLVEIPRDDGIRVEQRDNVLAHVFLHQVHHRGQVHAMLSGTHVAPPQLDEGILDEDRPRRAAEGAIGEY
jgi:uncharacterized damage-inducible protein DinB